MKVLCILTVYNEIQFLPYLVGEFGWCENNGLEPYVIDNYSTDATYAWLKHHEIPCHQVDTNETFDLRILQREIIETTDRLKPDWVCYTGADTFIFTDKRIVDICIKAEKTGHNMIGFPMIDMCNTGEPGGHPMRTYFWYRPTKHVRNWVYKWEPGLKYKADNVLLPLMAPIKMPGVMINYGRTKTPQERKVLLQRRKAAWRAGLDHKSGRHLLREQAVGWEWPKRELKDIRKSEYWKYLIPYQT